MYQLVQGLPTVWFIIELGPDSMNMVTMVITCYPACVHCAGTLLRAGWHALAIATILTLTGPCSIFQIRVR